MDRLMNKWMNEWIDGWMDRQTDRQMNEWTWIQIVVIFSRENLEELLNDDTFREQLLLLR